MLFSSPWPRQRIVTLRAWVEKNIAAWPDELPAPTMWMSWPCVPAASLRAAPYAIALPGEPVESVERQPPPRDPAREDDRPRPEDVAAVELHLPRLGVEPRGRPGHEDLGAEPAAPAAAPGSRARRRTRLTGSRGSSRSGTTHPPGRRALPARPRPSAVPPRLRRPPRRARQGLRRRSRCRTRRRPARSRGRAARRRGGAAAAPPSCRRSPESPASPPLPAAGRPTSRPRPARRASTHGT